MKKYQVTSIRKNPDKYIERLKSELDFAWSQSRYHSNKWMKERGIFVANYVEGVTDPISEQSLSNARKFKVGDHVIVEGEVYKIQKQDSGYCIYWTHKTVRVKPLDD